MCLCPFRPHYAPEVECLSLVSCPCLLRVLFCSNRLKENGWYACVEQAISDTAALEALAGKCNFLAVKLASLPHFARRSIPSSCYPLGYLSLFVSFDLFDCLSSPFTVLS